MFLEEIQFSDLKKGKLYKIDKYILFTPREHREYHGVYLGFEIDVDYRHTLLVRYEFLIEDKIHMIPKEHIRSLYSMKNEHVK